MLEYPSRSNLNCLVIVLRCIGRGCCLFNSYHDLSTIIITSDHYLSDPDWIRTNDLLLRRQLLYPLSYQTNCTWGGGRTRTGLTAHKILSLACIPISSPRHYDFPICQRTNSNIRIKNNIKKPEHFLVCSGLDISLRFYYSLLISEHK